MTENETRMLKEILSNSSDIIYSDAVKKVLKGMSEQDGNHILSPGENFVLVGCTAALIAKVNYENETCYQKANRISDNIVIPLIIIAIVVLIGSCAFEMVSKVL